MTKVYKQGSAGEPAFPEDFEVAQKAVLQVTDIKTNRNKYYAIELHTAGASFRVFTHYGRTDDLEKNPNAGARESRYFGSLAEAEQCYGQIYREKTSARKGYKEVSLAASKIGSHKARGKSSGHVDAKTIEKIQSKDGKPPAIKKSEIDPRVQEFVKYIYEEATNALTTTVAAKITANGIETPLGVLTVGQIERGEAILSELYTLFKQEKKLKHQREEMTRLSGDFYTTIPHRIGRTRAAVEKAVIDSLAEFEQKQETLQLMKDMLSVNGEAGSVLYDDQIDAKYKALGCVLVGVDPSSDNYKTVKDYVERSQIKTKSIRVKNLYMLWREKEQKVFTEHIENHRWLFHGSRARNWVGILSRGILLPKIVVGFGVNRTDPGWLGHGIYFGDAACTSLYYAGAGKRGTMFMAVARVALGKIKQYRKITWGLERPPDGFDSCHGVRNKPGEASEFADDEFVVYRTEQQRLEYLVELSA